MDDEKKTFWDYTDEELKRMSDEQQMRLLFPNWFAAGIMTAVGKRGWIDCALLWICVGMISAISDFAWPDLQGHINLAIFMCVVVLLGSCLVLHLIGKAIDDLDK